MSSSSPQQTLETEIGQALDAGRGRAQYRGQHPVQLWTAREGWGRSTCSAAADNRLVKHGHLDDALGTSRREDPASPFLSTLDATDVIHPSLDVQAQVERFPALCGLLFDGLSPDWMVLDHIHGTAVPNCKDMPDN